MFSKSPSRELARLVAEQLAKNPEKRLFTEPKCEENERRVNAATSTTVALDDIKKTKREQVERDEARRKFEAIQRKQTALVPGLNENGWENLWTK